MRTWKDSRWLPRACALLYVAMFVIAIQLAWGCAESNSQMVEPIERDVISVSKILLPQEFDEPFTAISLMILSDPEVLGLPCYPDSAGEIICPTVTFWRDTVYVTGNIQTDSIATDCIVEDPDNCVP